MNFFSNLERMMTNGYKQMVDTRLNLLTTMMVKIS